MLARKVRPLSVVPFSDGGKQSARQKNGSQVLHGLTSERVPKPVCGFGTGVDCETSIGEGWSQRIEGAALITMSIVIEMV